MKRPGIFWNVVQMLGLLVTVSGIVLGLAQPQPLTDIQRYSVAAALLASVGVAGVTGYLLARGRPKPYQSSEMQAKSKSLIRSARGEIVFLAGDMSWADEYVGPMVEAIRRGKAVTVVFPSTKRPGCEGNLQVLAANGVRAIETPSDYGFRALLVDPAESDAVLFTVQREKNRSGRKRPDRYTGQMCDRQSDPLLLTGMVGLYRSLKAALSEERQ